MAAVDAMALAEHGTDRLGMKYPVHLTAWGFGQMSALLSYLMIPFIKLFGLNPVSARLPSLLVSLLGLVALYFFVRKASNRAVALTVLAVAAVNPWHILQSRWALDCNLFPHFLMFGLLFLLAGEEKKWALFLSMVFFGLSMYCYGIALYTVPVFLFSACVYLISRGQIRVRDALVCTGVYLLVAWPFLLCMAINYFGWKTIETPLFSIPFFPDSLRSNDILFFSSHPGAQLIQNLRCTFRILCQIYNGLPWNEVRGFGTLYVFSLPFTLIGAVALFRRFRKNTGAALVCLLFLTGLLDGLITANVNINRINLIFYPLIVFCGAGICVTVRGAQRVSVELGILAGGLITALFLVGFLLFSRTYFTTYAEEISRFFMEDFGQAVTAVKDLDTDEYYITPDSQAKGYGHVSEILTLFYHQIDAEYYRSPEFYEKYHFRNPGIEIPDSNAVYVIPAEYADLFENSDFVLTEYGRFFTAVPFGQAYDSIE